MDDCSRRNPAVGSGVTECRFTTRSRHPNSYRTSRANVGIRVAARRPGTTEMGAKRPSTACVIYIQLRPKRRQPAVAEAARVDS